MWANERFNDATHVRLAGCYFRPCIWLSTSIRAQPMGRFGCEDYLSLDSLRGDSLFQCAILYTRAFHQDAISAPAIGYLQVFALKTSQAFLSVKITSHPAICVWMYSFIMPCKIHFYVFVFLCTWAGNTYIFKQCRSPRRVQFPPLNSVIFEYPRSKPLESSGCEDYLLGSHSSGMPYTYTRACQEDAISAPAIWYPQISARKMSRSFFLSNWPFTQQSAWENAYSTCHIQYSYLYQHVYSGALTPPSRCYNFTFNFAQPYHRYEDCPTTSLTFRQTTVRFSTSVHFSAVWSILTRSSNSGSHPIHIH